jgi:hypothetical protein
MPMILVVKKIYEILKQPKRHKKNYQNRNLMRIFSKYDNVITISGSNRNVGKTFLGENIITAFSKKNKIIAIKISKFKHKPSDKSGLIKCYETAHYTIWKELNCTNKDSGRYLKAGAITSYYIECDDKHLLEAFLYVYNKSYLIICESASITKYINPAISIFVESTTQPTKNNKLRNLKTSNLIFKEKSFEISNPQYSLAVQNNNWILNLSRKIA